jgi:coproporphyrinogen III oxidase-like Fe-S oxidoreductase
VIPVAQALSATVPLKDIQHYMRPGTLQLPVLPPLSLYVHLPWCLRKCPYCDFNSHEFRAGGEAGELPEQRYLDALVADLEPACRWSGAARCTAFSSAAARPACFRRRPSTACWATSGRGCR